MLSFEPLLPTIALELEARQLRRACLTHVLYRLSEDSPGTWRSLRAPWRGAESLVRELLRQRHGDQIAEIANERF